MGLAALGGVSSPSVGCRVVLYEAAKNDAFSLVERSEVFAVHLEKIAGQIQIFDIAPRSIVCATACELSIEQSHATPALFFAGAPNSACVTLRSQYEAVLRGAWALHIATDHQVKKHGQPLDAVLQVLSADRRNSSAFFLTLPLVGGCAGTASAIGLA